MAGLRLLTSPLVKLVQASRDKKLVLAMANPVLAFTDFSKYKEATIATREIQDSRGRVLGCMKLWIYPYELKCFREVSFINQLLMTSVGMNRVTFAPLGYGKGDTPAALFEVTAREFETWLRHLTPGTQFGIESARHATSKPQVLKVVSVMPEEQPPPLTVRQVQPAPLHTPVHPKLVQPPAQQSEPGRFAPSRSDSPIQEGQFLRAEPRPDIKAKAEEYTAGILQSVGMQERTIIDRKFKQYCFDILLTDGESRGMVKRIWGADLERALGESRALLGEKVDVCHHGSMPMPNAGGGSSYKNSYSMKVLK